MRKREPLKILKQGVKAWNKWRRENPDIELDLAGADLSEANLSEADLSGADLSEANLREAILRETILLKANLSGADLMQADLIRAYLCWANLSGAMLTGAVLSRADLSWADLSRAHLNLADLGRANLSEANLTGADLRLADLSGANLTGADLSGAHLVRANLRQAHLEGAQLIRAVLTETNLEQADLTNCLIYGVSAWGLKLEGTIQSNLIITLPDEPTITVDNLEVAQFIYLLLNNERIRGVIDTITTKVVLILGRFTPERKAVLDAIRDELRKRDYLPVVFDFKKPACRSIRETVSTLAHMSRFIIADISDPKSIPQEFELIVPTLTSVPVRPIIVQGQREWGMFEGFKPYPWVLPVYEYKDIPQLLASLAEQVISPAEAKVKELRSSPEDRAASAEASK